MREPIRAHDIIRRRINGESWDQIRDECEVSIAVAKAAVEVYAIDTALRGDKLLTALLAPFTPKLCSVEGCGKAHVAHDLCMAHYQAARRRMQEMLPIK